MLQFGLQRKERRVLTSPLETSWALLLPMPRQPPRRLEPMFPKPVPRAVPRTSPPFMLKNFPPTSASDIFGEAPSPKFTF